MEKIRKRLIHISRCRGITRRTIRKFIRHDSTLESIYKLSSSDISQFFSLPPKKAALFHSDLRNPSLKTQIKHELTYCRMITIVDDIYPPVLKTIKDAPLVLYAMGDIDLLTLHPMLSVIGTRKPSNEAMPKMKEYVLPLIQEGWVIVSGMAMGIDSYAHRLALNSSGRTIAVLGSGFDYIYPKSTCNCSGKSRPAG